MTCFEFLSVLHDYIDGETDPKTEKQIKEHAANCASCRKALKEMEAVKAAVGAAGDIPVPENIAEDVLGAIQNEIEGGRQRFHLPAFFTSWPMYVSIAACLILFFVLKDSYQRQFESYIYTEENGAVALTETTDIAKSRITDGAAAYEYSADKASPYVPAVSLQKHTITFRVSDAAAENVFNSARQGGTDAVIRALTEGNFAFSIEYSMQKDLTADYNKLAEEANALFIRLSEGDSNAAVALSQKEAQMLTISNDCAAPELKLVIN